MSFAFVDLFCGIGSFHQSLTKLGGKCVLACDINTFVCETYEKNYGVKPKGDICGIDNKDFPDFDILCAGIPCQPFSNIGKLKGFDDERGSLINQVTRILKAKSPKAFIIENVKGLVNHNEGETFKKMVHMLEECNYKISHQVLSCDNYGIPQMRKRLFIVGLKDKVFDFEAIKTIQTPSLSSYLGMNFKKDKAFTIRCGGRNSNITDRHNWDSYYLSNDEVYTLNVQDMKKLQGFPEEFVLCGSKKQQETMLGNTIPTNLTYVVGKELIKYIS
jgi:DNA (cytosine-5)-methyltransferase 1